MKAIPLTQGKAAFVSDEDYLALSMFKWHAAKGRTTWYAQRQERRNGKRVIIKMHSQILGFPDLVDHADGNGLNNQRTNIRACTDPENSANRSKMAKETTSRFKGVAFHVRDGRYSATIGKDGRRYWIGSFDNEHDAAIHYNVAAQLFFGRFAKLNEV